MYVFKYCYFDFHKDKVFIKGSLQRIDWYENVLVKP